MSQPPNDESYVQAPTPKKSPGFPHAGAVPSQPTFVVHVVPDLVHPPMVLS